MTTKVLDDFNGVAGTDLAAHTPDIGGPWIDSRVNAIELDGSSAIKFAAQNDTSRIDAGTTNQWCVTNFNAGGADNRISILLRRDNLAYASMNCYLFNYRPGDAVSTLKINKVVSGARTLLASTAFTNNSSTTYSQEPEIDGSNLDWLIDGVSELSITDTSITTGDYAGVVHEKYSSTAARFYDFKIDDAAPAVGGFQSVWATNATTVQSLQGMS